MTFDLSVSLQYAGINIGPVHKKDVMKASAMLEHDPQYVTPIGRLSGVMFRLCRRPWF